MSGLPFTFLRYNGLVQAPAAAEGPASPSGAVMLAARLREFVARMHGPDPEVRENAADSEHQMRLAVRRLRGTLAVALTPRVVVARTLQAAAAALGVQIGDDVGHLCPRCGSDRHGRPFLPGHDDLDVSRSRADGLSVVALARGARIGVDVEVVDDGRFGWVGDVLLHAQERVAGPHEVAVTWVRKEALLKALGTGLSVDPRDVWLSGAQEPPTVLAWPAGYARPAATLVDLRLPTGLVGAVAVLAEEEPDVRLLLEGPAALSS